MSDNTTTEGQEKAMPETYAVTEERKTMLDVMNKRMSLDHSIVLHRDSASAADVLAMIGQLQAAGMPLEATLQVDGNNHHTRVYARWSEAVS